MSAKSDQMRKEWAENDAKRDAGLTTPENVQRFDDIAYGPVPKWNTLDVYRPKDEEGILPVIVSVHGGGWVYGDKELYQFYGMTLAQRGFAVVNYSYRLAPEYKFPAQIEDLNAVIEWMYENADTYKLDMKHVFMVGDSAGGHMAALYADICTNSKLAEKYPTVQVPNHFVPKALGLNCGAYVPIDPPEERAKRDPNEQKSADQDMELMGDLLPGKGTDEEAELINTTLHVTPAFPPVYLMTCVGDFCKPQAPKLEKVLKENRIPFVYKIYGTEKAPLYHVFHVTVQEPMGQLCNDEECEFFRRFL